MTGAERSELADLNARLFGLDGEHGALGSIEVRLTAIEGKLNRWDGAISLVKAAASVLGVGGIALILAALVNAAPS
jgi:hypothetical protein